MKRRISQVCPGSFEDTFGMPPVLMSSPSTDSLSSFPGYENASPTADIQEAQRNVRPRITQSGRQSHPRSAYPTTYTTSLQEILTRYHNWSTAVTQGKTGISKMAHSQLCHKVAEKGCKHVCTLCLDSVKEGESFTTLSCGHVFHKGSNEEDDGGCKGILYWLKSNVTCPHCRVELDPEVPVPSSSEQVIVPLLNRQFALIQAQARLIERQRRELQTMQRPPQPRPMNKQSESDSELFDVFMPNEHASEPLRPIGGMAHPTSIASSGQWQDGVEHHVHRVHILGRVTKIAVSALNGRLSNCSAAKMRKLTTLAAKVELLLFSEASSLEEYKTMATLKTRVLNKIKGLIWRAKQLRRVRHEGPVPMGALVF